MSSKQKIKHMTKQQASKHGYEMVDKSAFDDDDEPSILTVQRKKNSLLMGNQELRVQDIGDQDDSQQIVGDVPDFEATSDVSDPEKSSDNGQDDDLDQDEDVKDDSNQDSVNRRNKLFKKLQKL